MPQRVTMNYGKNLSMVGRPSLAARTGRAQRPAPPGLNYLIIHVKVTAPGFRGLVTQHYPQKGEKQGTFDLVLIPTG
jgi:hypothetical protein